MGYDRERRMLLAGIGAAGALAMARTARAASCGDPGPLGPTGPTMNNIYNKIAFTDEGLAEARKPITSCPSTPTAQFSITDPGVYYMVANITGVPGKACVEVLCDHVEIEGDGWIMVGAPGTGECIRTPSPQQCIGIYDLGFSGWQQTCINLSNSLYCYCEEVWFHLCDASTSSAGLGACALGAGGTMDDCSVLACTHGQLSVDRDGIIEECVVIDSTGGGLSSPGPCTMEDNFVLNNDGTGISVGSGGGILTGNRVCSCPTGYFVSPSSGSHSSVVAENDASDCTTGIQVAGVDVTVEENHAGRCTNAILISGGASRVLVDGNHCPGSSSTAITLENTTTRCLVVRNAVACPPGVSGYALGGANSWGHVVSALGVGDLTAGGTVPDAWSNFEH